MQRIGLISVLIILAGCAVNRVPDPPEGGARAIQQTDVVLGSSAKRLCSSVFVSGRRIDDVLRHELEGAAEYPMGIEVDRERGLVTLELGDRKGEALYRPGLGCTLVVDATVRQLKREYDSAAHPAPTRPRAPWPVGDDVALPTSVEGIDLAAVNRAIDASFDDIEPDQNIRTRAALVVHRGQIIAERYGHGFTAETPQLGWSMTKTVTNLLTGMLVKDGLLDVAAPAPVAAWQADEQDRRSAITLNHLLQMSSSLAFSEVYTDNSLSDVIVMLFTKGDTGAFAASKPLLADPGERWAYSSGTTNIISRIHRDLFDERQAYFNFPRERLFNPLGMASAVIEPDASGSFVGSSYMYATPRDWAKIGLLLMNDGVWQGERLVPEGWVAYSTTPAPAAPLGNYGAQIWLNAGDDGESGTLPHAGLPASMYYLSGFEGQNVVVLPEHELIVVRMGLTTSGPRPIWPLVRGVLDAFGEA